MTKIKTSGIAAIKKDRYITTPVIKNVKIDFAMICKGDGMINARIFDGDIVYFHSQNTVENGEIAAVLVGEEVLLKKVYYHPDNIVLSSCNPVYNDIVYRDEQLKDVRILGKAVYFIGFINNNVAFS